MAHYQTKSKVLHLSDERFTIEIDHVLKTVWLDMVDRFMPICELKYNQTEEEMIKEGEAMYLLHGCDKL